MVGGFSKVLDRRGNSLSQNGIAILATISSTHYLLSTSSKHRNKCSRIELKMTETEQSNCIGQSAPFVMQLALRLCFCQMPIASITNGFTETLKLQWWCHTSESTHTEGRVTPPRQTEGWSPTKGRTPPSVPEANRGKRAPSIVYLTKVPAGSLSSSDAVSLASSEKRSELSASESESEVLAGFNLVYVPPA